MRVLRGDGGRAALTFGVALTIVAAAGCGGGGGGGGGASVAGISSPSSGSTPTVVGLQAIDLFPPGDVQIAGTGGQWSSQQIILDGYYVDGAVRDLTRTVTFSVADEKVATVSGDGLVTGVNNGTTELTVDVQDAQGQTLEIKRTIKVDDSKGLPSASGATPTKLEFWPASRILQDVDSTQGKEQLQQVTVRLTYSDGRVEDVTRSIVIKVLDPKTGNPSIAARITTSGLVRATQEGETVDVGAFMTANGPFVMPAGARYILGKGQRTAGNPTLYSGAPLAGSTNPFDVAALSALSKKLIEPSPISNDNEFLRRVTADLVGRLPTEAELQAFVTSQDKDKRAKKIDELLASSEFGAHWGKDIVAGWLCFPTSGAPAAFEGWLIDALNKDTPISSIATDLAQGTNVGGVEFDKIFNDMPKGTGADMIAYRHSDQLVLTFAGMTTKCTRCHDHPLTGPADDPRLVQDQGYGLYAFFASTPAQATKVNKAGAAFGGPVQPAFFLDGTAKAVTTGLPTLADPLATRRAKFAQLFTASDAFARGTGHRIFSEIMTPLLDPNQFLAKNIGAVTVPTVLQASTDTFKAQNASLKGYLRTLCGSKLYQLSTFGKDTKNDALLARMPVRRHHGEVLDAAITSVTGIADSAPGAAFFKTTFGYPTQRLMITERTDAINLGQAFVLLNSPLSVSQKVQATGSNMGKLATDVDSGKITLDAAIITIYRTALTRDATASEIALIKSQLAGVPTKEALEDVAAVVMASNEFVMR